jgi:hypothetical protein
MRSKIRKYSELRHLRTMKDRFDYLKLSGVVGQETFGYDRYLNQIFYKTTEWKNVRRQVIIRDNGCDLGIDGYEIHDKVIIHHMNPVQLSSLVRKDDDILNPDFLICVSHNTHQAIHYGDFSLVPQGPIVRKPGDTRLW